MMMTVSNLERYRGDVQAQVAGVSTRRVIGAAVFILRVESAQRDAVERGNGIHIALCRLYCLPLLSHSEV